MSRIQELVGERLTVAFDGLSTTLTVVDWDELVRITDELGDAVSGLPREERNRLLQGAYDPGTDIFEYFLGDLADQVLADELVPFGLLGLTHAADSFAEEFHKGVLLLDVREKDLENAPVLWLPHNADTPVPVAERLADLSITPA